MVSKEYLGINAVKDLFDIIAENYVSKEEFLKAVEAIIIAKGAAGGGDNLIATDSEVNEILNKYF